MTASIDKYGRGIVCPFQRDGKGDFANDAGMRLLKSDVGELLGIIGPRPGAPGELPWDMARGSNLQSIRHRHVHSSMVQAQAQQYISDALRRIEERVVAGPVRTQVGPGETELRITVAVAPRGQRVGPITVEVPVIS